MGAEMYFLWSVKNMKEQEKWGTKSKKEWFSMGKLEGSVQYEKKKKTANCFNYVAQWKALISEDKTQFHSFLT